jgi:hypothetical protein
MQKQDPKKRTTKSSASYSSQIPVVDWIKKNDLIVGLGIILILVLYHFFPLLFDGNKWSKS